MPKRGAVALVTTVLAVVLLFAFKPVDQSGRAADIPSSAVVGPLQATPGPIAAGPVQQHQGVATSTPRPAAQPTSRAGTGQATIGPSTQATPTDPPVSNGVNGTFTGDAFQTAYGTVQIALQVQNGKIVDVQELQMPGDRRLSAQISAQAGPLLRDEVLRSQSAKIDGVSGASYTSYGFWKSLQSALAQVS